MPGRSNSTKRKHDDFCILHSDCRGCGSHPYQHRIMSKHARKRPVRDGWCRQARREMHTLNPASNTGAICEKARLYGMPTGSGMYRHVVGTSTTCSKTGKERVVITARPAGDPPASKLVFADETTDERESNRPSLSHVLVGAKRKVVKRRRKRRKILTPAQRRARRIVEV